MPVWQRWLLNGIVVALVLLNICIVLAFVQVWREMRMVKMPQPLVVRDDAGQIQLELNPDWSVSPTRPADCILQATNSREDAVILVIYESKAPLAAADPRYLKLSDYGQLLRNLLLKTLSEGSQQPPVALTIGGLPAVQAEVQGVTGESELTFLHTVIEAEDAFYQVRVVTTSSRFPQLRSQLAAAVSTFRVLKTK